MCAAESQSQIRQESRLTSVDLNLKNGVFHGWNKIHSDVHSCSFHALSKYEKTIGSRAAWPEAIQWSVIKEPQNGIYCLNFSKNYKILNLRVLIPCFIPEVTCSVVCRRIVSFLFALQCIFHCMRTWCVVWERYCLSEIATVTVGGWVVAIGCERSIAHPHVVPNP